MKKILIAFTLVALYSLSSSAQSIVIDATSTNQALANGVAAKAQEDQITQETDKSKAEQNKVQQYVLLIEQHVDMIEKAQKDISAFRKEGAAIQLFVLKTRKATKALSELAKILPQNVIGLVGSSNLIAQLSLDIYGICDNMVNTVIDGKFTMPAFGPVKPKPHINFLEPQERLAFYQRCAFEMDRIYYKIMYMNYTIVSTNSVKAAFRNIAPKTTYTIDYGRSVAEDIIKSWKK